jgi:NDP-sugar pyrophosphorylase family protein
MIELVIRRLIDFGIEEIVVNTHYLARQVEDYFAVNNFGVKISLSFEEEILGTGGGIKNAGRILKDTDNFIVHNVDVLSDIDFVKMAEFHSQNGALATLAVKRRDTTRPLIIDDSNFIVGRKSPERAFRYRKPQGSENAVGFCGIHIISSQIFVYFEEKGVFDIFTTYFRLISENRKIMAFDTGDSVWKDLGKTDKNILETDFH